MSHRQGLHSDDKPYPGEELCYCDGPKPTNQNSNNTEFVFVNNGDPEDTEWAAHINLLNEWTEPGYILRYIIQTARAGEFRPADMHVDLIEQWHRQLIRNEFESVVPEKKPSELHFQEKADPRAIAERYGYNEAVNQIQSNIAKKGL